MSEKLTLRKPKPGKLDNVTVEQLKLDRERMSVGYMAKEYGVSKSTMYRALRKAGLVEVTDKT